MRFFHALRKLGKTTLIISHQTKGRDESKKPFGSTFWHNAARTTIEAKHIKDDEDALHICLLHRKSNDSALYPGFGYKVEIAEDTVQFIQEDISQQQEFQNERRLQDRLRDELYYRDEANVKELADTLETTVGSVRNTLNKNKAMFEKKDNGNWILIGKDMYYWFYNK